jgi:hypothetical protein
VTPADLAQQHCFVVPAYGDSPFLAACLQSIQSQAVLSRMVITTSTPSSYIDAAAREHAAEVIVNPERNGIAADWNFGLRSSGARFVTLAHQDDVYFPNFLQRTLELFARHPDGALCFTGYQEIDDQGKAKSSKISRAKHLLEAITLGHREVARGLALRGFLSFGNPLPCSSVTFDLGQLPGFSFSADFDSNLDWEAWWRLYKDGAPLLHAKERLIGRRHNPMTATSRLIRDGVRWREDVLMFRRLWPAPLGDAIAHLYKMGY